MVEIPGEKEEKKVSHDPLGSCRSGGLLAGNWGILEISV